MSSKPHRGDNGLWFLQETLSLTHCTIKLNLCIVACIVTFFLPHYNGHKNTWIETEDFVSPSYFLELTSLTWLLNGGKMAKA